MATSRPDSGSSTPRPRQIYSYISQPHLYSDHYPKNQNTPEGTISIAFSKSCVRSIHTNNDLVKGVVLVRSRVRVKHVTIKFIGRSSCRIPNERNPATQHTATVELFHHEKILQPLPEPSGKCPPGRIEYPFDFRFPEAVEEDAQQQNNTPFPHDAAFEHTRHHPLPPSLWWNESTVRNEYFLEAQLLTAEHSFTMNPIVIQQLRFFPSVPELTIPPCPMTHTPPIRIERCTPSPPPGRNPLVRLRSTLHPDTDASAASLLVLSVPSHYRVATSSALFLALTATLSAAPNPPPPIYLRGIRAQATAHIAYRVPLPGTTLTRSGTATFDLFNRRYATPGLRIHGATALDVFEINRIVPPSFRSYAVALAYDVRYDLLLECGGREAEHVVEVDGVQIEAMTRPGGELGPPEEREGEGGLGRVESREPPPYEP